MDRLTFGDDHAAPNTCRNCNRDIPPRIGRVAGDERGVVPVCEDCYTPPNGLDPGSTWRAIRAWRSRRANPMEAEDD